MLDVESMFESIKAAWVIRIINADKDEKWCIVAKHVLEYDYKEGIMLKMTFTKKNSIYILNKFPGFYKEVILAFNKAKCISREVFCETILEQSLWGNPHVTKRTKKGKMTMLYKNWVDSDIVKIKNL